MLRPNHGADVGVGVIARAEAKLFRFRDAARSKLIAYRLLDEEALDGKTNLPAIRVAAPNRGACGDVEVRIGEDEHGVFATKLQHRRNQPLGAGFGDAAACCHTSREQDFVWIGIDQRLAHFPTALHDGASTFPTAAAGKDILDERAILRTATAAPATSAAA